MAKIALPDRVMGKSADAEAFYAPSIIDRITDRARRLPMPPWLFYVAFALFTALLYTSVKWFDGSVPLGQFVLYLVMNGITFIYLLALLHFLDDWAGKTLDEFRATMRIEQADFDKLRYKLTTLPVWPTVIALVIGGLFLLGSFGSFAPEDARQNRLFTSPLATVFDYLFGILDYAMIGLFLYHTVRQLRLLNHIYITYAQVDLFNLGPMYALSRLTARTAIGFGLITYVWLFLAQSTVTFQELLTFALLAYGAETLIIIATFIWPLLGAHRLISAEKDRLKTQASLHMKTNMEELHRLEEAHEFDKIGKMNDVIHAVQREHAVLDKISTWPWQAETLRGFASAILLPVVIWAIIRILGQLFGS